jgi:hypothetical protein
MSEKNNGYMHPLSVIASALVIFTTLAGFLSWKIDAANMAQAKIISKEVEEKYVTKEVFCLTIDNFSEKLKSIGKAVGARMREN